MKGKLKWLGIIFISVVLVFSFTVCDNGNDGNNNGGTGNNGGNGGTGSGNTSTTFTMNGHYVANMREGNPLYLYNFANYSGFQVSVTIGEETKIIPSFSLEDAEFNFPPTVSSVTVSYSPSNKVYHNIIANGFVMFMDIDDGSSSGGGGDDDCNLCSGSGKCWLCDGHGNYLSGAGRECWMCSGTGDCSSCYGSGKQ